MGRKSILSFSGCLVILGLISISHLAVATFAQNGPTPVRDEFVIDDYQFQWTVLSTGDVKMLVVKTQDATNIRLDKKGSIGFLTMKPADAEAVAMILATTEEKYQSLKGSQDKDEKAEAGGYIIRFCTGKNGDFYVSLSMKESFSSSVMMDRKEAVALAPVMAKAKKLASFVDEKIKP